MEFLHTYHDGSRLFKMSARALSQIPIWKGNRIIDLEHVNNIKLSISNNVELLDSGYKIIQYQEEDQDGILIHKSYLIDGQHRLSILSDYFQKNIDAKDFIVTVTEIRVESESDAITYFNQINNVKPIRFEEDANMIINRYIKELQKSYPEKLKLFRNGQTRRPYLSIDKLREALQKMANQVKHIPLEQFVNKCHTINNSILLELKSRILNNKDKEINIIKKMIELEFGLAWDDKYKWLNTILSNK
jgi:ribosome-associated translation inhibitor RaiA